MTIDQRILKLRDLLKKTKIDAYIIPTSDPHQSEYVADHWKSREWISGFTGSAGVVVVTADHAGLWTDSRYYLQAGKELAKSEVKLHKQKVQGAPEHIHWLVENLPEGSKIGCFGMLFSIGQTKRYQKVLAKKSMELVFTDDLVDKIWMERPPIPQHKIFALSPKYAGQTRGEKIATVRNILEEKKADYYLITTLDDIAWVFNIRGTDVACNPVAIAYAVIGKEKSYLFTGKGKVPAKLAKALHKDGIEIAGYYDINAFLKSIPHTETIYIDAGSTSSQLYNDIQSATIHSDKNIIRPLKAIKNKTEVAWIKKAMLKDGIALTKMFMWLEKTVKKRPVPETEVAEKLIEFRSERGNYHGESFDAIVGYKDNGAIVHYFPEKETCANIKNKGMLLVDSGGQYTEGTTDITRTITLGKPTKEQKRNFTLVLKGHIALGSIVFPKGTKGVQLDTLARMFLWNNRLNYGHGTGHGVGFFLNVHEPPQGIIPGLGQRGVTVFEPGMFTSNEPGFYKEGAYGIRIENLVLCVEDKKNEFGDFLKFDTLTLFPIDLNLIDKKIMEKHEIKWLNKYHKKVFNKIAPHLTKKEKAWLKKKCRAI